MAKDNAQIQQDKRAKEKAVLERIDAEKRTLIVSKALNDALQVLGERHHFEEWQETISTMNLNLATAPAGESERFFNMARPEIVGKKSGRGSLKSSPRRASNNQCSPHTATKK